MKRNSVIKSIFGKKNKIVNRYRSLNHPEVSGKIDEMIFKIAAGPINEWISLKEIDEKEREEMRKILVESVKKFLGYFDEKV